MTLNALQLVKTGEKACKEPWPPPRSLTSMLTSLAWLCFGMEPSVLQPGQSVWRLISLTPAHMAGCNLVKGCAWCASFSIIQQQFFDHLIGGHQQAHQCNGSCSEIASLWQSSHWLKQNQNHNGCSSHAHVNNVFVFDLDRLVRCATVNCSGSWHNST